MAAAKDAFKMFGDNKMGRFMSVKNKSTPSNNVTDFRTFSDKTITSRQKSKVNWLVKSFTLGIVCIQL